MNIRLVLILILSAAGIFGYILLQIKARFMWRMLSTAVVLIVCCKSCSAIARVTATQDMQRAFQEGIREFVKDIETMAVAGRTNEVVRVCEKFQTNFNMWPEGQSYYNFLDLVGEASTNANSTNSLNMTHGR